MLTIKANRVKIIIVMFIQKYQKKGEIKFMKIKKTVTIILLIMLMVLQFSFIGNTVHAADGETKEDSTIQAGMQGAMFASVKAVVERRMNVTLNRTNEEEINPGKTFELVVHLDNFQNIEKGMRYIQAQLEYDKDVLEYAGILGQNGWILEKESFNEQNGKFIIDNKDGITNPSDAFKISFRVKTAVEEDTETVVTLKGIRASGGDGIIKANDASAQVSIVIPEEPDLPEEITSNKYVVEDDMISRIIPGTTVKEFIKNVETKNVDNDGIVILNQDGNTLNENDVIASGMTIKVGKTLQFTASVIGDVDGDGQITVNDLAKVKLHYIVDTPLTGAYLKAADVDGLVEDDSPVGMNDIARIKLVLINLAEIK